MGPMLRVYSHEAWEEPMPFTRRLVAAWLAAGTGFTIVSVAPAWAASNPERLSLAPAWAAADVTVVRDGWTVLVTGTLTDTRDDGDCVYLRADLEVDNWYDPDDRTGNLCGPGARRQFEIPLSPARGSRLVELRLRVCAADRLSDSCEEEALPVPAERAKREDLKADIDRYLRMPLAKFLRARSEGPGPFDWSSDGCTDAADEPHGWNFRDACHRHDFAYRNYGVGRTQASPTDHTRAAADRQFRKDLLDECAGVEERRRCEGLAETYYTAVRRGSGRAFYT